MALKTTDRLIAPSRGSAAGWSTRIYRDAAPPDDVWDYLTEVYAVAPLVGVDAALVVAQSVWETDSWTSQFWRTRRNPAGLGVTGDPAQNATSPTFATGADAARAQIGHLLVYALGPSDAGSLWHRAVGGDPLSQVDPRYNAYLEAYGNAAKAETIADLAGTWAVDSAYASGIVARGNAIFPGIEDQQAGGTPTVPQTIVFGRVKHPPFERRDIPSSVNTAWDDLGPRAVKAICWHRSQGSHQGNDTYFRGEGRTRALTDYGIGVAAIDGALAGSIYRWNDPLGTRSPYANGRVSNPYGDGLAFFQRYGINGVNRFCTSVEISGFFPVPGEETRNTPLDPKSREALAQLTAYWADQYRVSWETFPLIPGEGNRSFVIHHDEFTIGTGKTCPGPIVKQETPAIIERARQIMKAAQTEAVPVPEPKPEPQPEPAIDYPEGMDGDLAEAWFGEATAKGQNYSFNPSGPVSRLWLETGRQTGRWPKLAKVETYGTRVYFRFADGLTIWKPNDQSAVAVLK